MNSLLERQFEKLHRRSHRHSVAMAKINRARRRNLLVESLEEKRLLAVSIVDDSSSAFSVVGPAWGTTSSAAAFGGGFTWGATLVTWAY